MTEQIAIFHKVDFKNSATKARCKICMKDIDIAKMGVSELKSHSTGDRHNCILKKTREK